MLQVVEIVLQLCRISKLHVIHHKLDFATEYVYISESDKLSHPFQSNSNLTKPCMCHTLFTPVSKTHTRSVPASHFLHVGHDAGVLRFRQCHRNFAGHVRGVYEREMRKYSHNLALFLFNT